jgi:hypothetical protein
MSNYLIGNATRVATNACGIQANGAVETAGQAPGIQARASRHAIEPRPDAFWYLDGIVAETVLGEKLG